MNDSDKTKDQLIEELTTLRRQYAEVITKSAAEGPGEAAEACVGNQKLLDTIIEEAPTCIKLIAADGTLQSMNRAGLNMIEAESLDQVKGLCVYSLISEDYREAFKTLAEEVFKGVSKDLKFKMIGLKGRPVWLYTRAVPLRNEKGEIVSALATTIDITERKQAEEALRKSEEKYRALVETSFDWVWEVDEQGLYTYASPRVQNILGYAPDEVVGKTPFDFMLPDEGVRIAKLFRECVAKEEPIIRLENKNLRKDGEEVILETSGLPIFDAEGAFKGYRGIDRDITERKHAEEKLRQSEKFIRNMLDTVDEGFVVIDRNFRILNANNAYCRLHDGSCDEVIGRYCYEIAHKRQTPCYEEGEECSVRRVFDTGEPCAVSHRHVDATGELMYVETKAFPIKDSSGTVISVIETVNNITERYLLEEERLKTQKIEAIGTLAGGIAHDFNNLLQGVFGYISMAKLTYDQKEKSLAMLEQAEKALQQSVNLTTQLLTFSKGGKPVKRRVDLKPIIENSVKFSLSGSRCDCRIMLEEGLWTVEADEGQIGQVIQNIVLNAEQAMPEGGMIAVTARNLHQEQSHDKLLKPGTYVEVSISDTGIGIPEKYLQKIFDPYFTTKEKGSGLGLATSYSIVKNHGGVIDVASHMGRGTTFSVYLPAGEAAEVIHEEPAAVSVARKGRILVMDDEEIVLNIAGEMIRALGHDVDSANHGQSAIEKYRAAMESGKPYDVVILDLTIRGGMGGEETVKQLLSIDPAVRAIVSSGYADDTILSAYQSHGFKAFLPKPYKIEDLRHTLNLLLCS